MEKKELSNRCHDVATKSTDQGRGKLQGEALDRPRGIMIACVCSYLSRTQHGKLSGAGVMMVNIVKE